MQSRPVPSANVFPSVPTGIPPSTQTLILAEFLNRFEQKKEDTKKSLHQQVDDVVDDLFHQLYSELMRVLPTIVTNESNQSQSCTNNAALERPNILMFAGANSLSQAGGNSFAINSINANTKSLLNNGNNLQASQLSSATTTLFPLQTINSSVNHNPNTNPNPNLNPNYSSNICSGEPVPLLNGNAKLFATGQKRESPSKDLTSRPSQAISKHTTGKLANAKQEPIDDDRTIDDHPRETVHTINSSAITLPKESSCSSSSVIVTTNSTLTTTNSCTGSSSVLHTGTGNSPIAGGGSSTCLTGLSAANHSATPSPGAQHESTPAIARVQQLHPHITHAAQHHYHAPGTHHSTPVMENTPVTNASPTIRAQSPPITVSNVSPTSQAQQAHQHHHNAAPPSTTTPAPAHQSHAHNFDAGAPVIVSTGSIVYHNNSTTLSTAALSDDTQPVNLSTSAAQSSPGVVQKPYAPSTGIAIPTTSASPIEDFDCPDEDYSDSDCDCEQCVGVQICKVDVNDDDHDSDLSRPLKKRLSKRARTDDSDDTSNANPGPEIVLNNKTNSKTESTRDNNGLAGLGLNDCPPSPSLNGDFQGDDDGEEECSATFKTISIKCSQNDCLSMFKSKIERNQHLLNAHNILPYTCLASGCNKGFDNVRQYGEHVSNEHSDVSNWACPKCSKVCPDHRMLCRHIYFYHQEGRFKCRKAKCNFVASFRIDVRKHSQLHTEMYACQFGCGKSFSHTHHRKRHERIHLRLKPFKCKWPNCGYSSEARSTVIRHIRIRHFNLPLTLKQQNELNIVDNRDPRDYMEILTELMN